MGDRPTERVPSRPTTDIVVVLGMGLGESDLTDDWSVVLRVMKHAFVVSQHAAADGDPLVYVVHNDDLLGRRGPGPAMVATGLLSAARTLALEMAKVGVAVNVLAVSDESTPAAIETWINRLAEPDGPTGELVHLGAGHIGKALA